MFSYGVIDSDSYFQTSDIFENAYSIGKKDTYIFPANKIINFNLGTDLNIFKGYKLLFKINPEFTDLNINSSTEFSNNDNIIIMIKNNSNKDIIVEPYKSIIHFLSITLTCENHNFTCKHDSVVEQVVEQVAEQVAEPVAEQVTEPVAEQVTEPVAEQVTEPVVESVVEPVVEPVVESVAEPVVESVVEPVAEPVVEPIVESVVEQVVESVVESVANLTVEPIAEQVVESIAEPVAEHTDASESESEEKKSNDKHSEIIKKRKYIRKKKV
jgi:hypothetical protein